jgi:hypothetical protein
MADPYFSELKYLGGRALDFIEVVVDGGTNVADITVTIYNSNGTVRSINPLGVKVATVAGKDVYIIDNNSPNFSGLGKGNAISIDTGGTVHSYISFDDRPAVTATAGPAIGLTSTQVGQAGRGDSLETSDGGATYTTQTTPTSGSIPCFVRGTQIETSHGLKKVEDLRSGDLLKNQSGALVEVKLILSTKVSARILSQHPKLRPICISAGCLGLGLPARDLLVSPQHRILVSSPIVKRMFGEKDALVAAIRLTSLPGVFQVSDIDVVEYFHVIMPNHEILISEGIMTESFLIGPEASDILNSDQMAEVETLFPDLLARCSTQPAARYIPTNKLQKKLIMRHAKNNRSIVCQ